MLLLLHVLQKTKRLESKDNKLESNLACNKAIPTNHLLLVQTNLLQPLGLVQDNLLELRPASLLNRDQGPLRTPQTKTNRDHPRDTVQVDLDPLDREWETKMLANNNDLQDPPMLLDMDLLLNKELDQGLLKWELPHPLPLENRDTDRVHLLLNKENLLMHPLLLRMVDRVEDLTLHTTEIKYHC